MTCPIKKTTSLKSFAQRCAELDPCYTEPEIIYDGATCSKMYAEWCGNGEWESLMWQIGKWVYNNDTMRNEFQLADIPCNTVCNEEQVMFTGLKDDDYVILMTACVYDETGTCCCKNFDFCNCLTICPTGYICEDGICVEEPFQLNINVPVTNGLNWQFRYRIGTAITDLFITSLVNVSIPVLAGKTVEVTMLVPPDNSLWEEFGGTIGTNNNSAVHPALSNAPTFTVFTMPQANSTVTLNFSYVFTKLCGVLFDNTNNGYCKATSGGIFSDTINSTVSTLASKFWKQLNSPVSVVGSSLSSIGLVPDDYPLITCSPAPCEDLTAPCKSEPLCIPPKFGLSVNSSVCDGSPASYPIKYRTISIGDAGLDDGVDFTSGYMQSPGSEFDPTKEFTMEFWIYINDDGVGTPFCHAFFDKAKQGTSGANLIAFQIAMLTDDGGPGTQCSTENGFTVGWTNTTSNTLGWTWAASNFPFKKWLHIVIVNRAPTLAQKQIADLFINGVLISGGVYSDNNYDLANFRTEMLISDAYIGTGTTDDVGIIYNRTRIFQDQTPLTGAANSMLSQQEITSLFNVGQGVEVLATPKKLILDFHYNGYTQDTVGVGVYKVDNSNNPIVPSAIIQKATLLGQNGTIYSGRLKDGFSNTNFINATLWYNTNIPGLIGNYNINSLPEQCLYLSRQVNTGINSSGTFRFSSRLDADFQIPNLPMNLPAPDDAIVTKYNSMDSSAHAPFGNRGRTTTTQPGLGPLEDPKRLYKRKFVTENYEKYVINGATWANMTVLDQANYEEANYVSRYVNPVTKAQYGLTSIEWAALPSVVGYPFPIWDFQNGYTQVSAVESLTYIPAYLKI